VDGEILKSGKDYPAVFLLRDRGNGNRDAQREAESLAKMKVRKSRRKSQNPHASKTEAGGTRLMVVLGLN